MSPLISEKNYLNYETVLTNANSTLTVTIYKSNRATLVSGGSMTNSGAGLGMFKLRFDLNSS